MNKISKLLLALVLVTFVLAGCAAPNVANPSGPRDSVSLGIEPNLNYLVLIAQDQGYFSEEGVDVNVVEYTSGKKVLSDVLDGVVEVGVIGHSPLVFASFDRDDFRIFGSVSTLFDLYKVVARKDSGIQEPADLKGKRIGTSEASSFHYFLRNILIEYGFSEDDVELVFLDAAELPAALAKGDVDAISTREPYISEAVSLLGDNYVVFSEPNLPSNTLNLIALEGFFQEKPQAVVKLLRALIRAQEFAAQNPTQAVGIVATRLGVAEAEIQSQWDKTEFEISLSQELVLSLENIAQWAIQEGLTDVSEIPNYLNYLYLDGLDTVKPDAITIIR